MFKPLFTGKLLRLAVPEPEDMDIMAVWSKNDTYMRLLDDDPVRPQFAADFSDFRNQSHDSFYFHLRTLEDDTFIGFVVLFSIKWASQTSSMAIGIGENSYRGKGYGADALRLILNYAFAELNLYRVSLTVMSYNADAIRAYERVGFVKEGVQRGMVKREGQRYDMVLYGILREEWEATQIE